MFRPHLTPSLDQERVAANTRVPEPRSPWSEVPSFADVASTRAPSSALHRGPPQARETSGASVPERTPPTSGLPRFRLLFLDGDPVSAQEPRRGRFDLPTDDVAWDGAQSSLAWGRREPELPSAAPNVFPSLVGEPRSTEAAPASGPWPELPPAPTPESAEAVVELRQWERRRRLDREQRGD
ncbi:hypothetical protein ACLESD_09210 [Pyxidicoccus sp. 3LFB2]